MRILNGHEKKNVFLYFSDWTKRKWTDNEFYCALITFVKLLMHIILPTLEYWKTGVQVESIEWWKEKVDRRKLTEKIELSNILYNVYLGRLIHFKTWKTCVQNIYLLIYLGNKLFMAWYNFVFKSVRNILLVLYLVLTVKCRVYPCTTGFTRALSVLPIYFRFYSCTVGTSCPFIKGITHILTTLSVYCRFSFFFFFQFLWVIGV